MEITTMAESLQKGQFPKCCELCENDIKINWKCLNCDILMCTKCKEIHSKIKSVDKHKIIDIKEVGKHSKELDFGKLNCEDHEGQTCVMFCKSCDQLVCLQCMAGVHNGHRFVQVIEGYKIKIENAKEIQKQVKNYIEELINGESKIKSLRKDENSKYTETKKLIQAQNEALKREVDKYTEKCIKELDQKWETFQNYIAEEERKVKNLKNKTEDQNTKVDNIINANDAVQIFKECKQMGTFKNEGLEPVKLDFPKMPKFLPGEITENNFGSLQDVTKDLVLNIDQQFTTGINKVGHLSTCPDTSLWISDQKVIQRVKPEGSNLKVMYNLNMEVYGMAVTPSNEILLATYKPRLQKISGSSGQVTDSVYSVDPFFTIALHVTSDYKVIVGAKSPGPAWTATGIQVLIKMNKEGKHEKTYEHDRNKQPIFTYIRRITTTTNGTIFVVDMLSKDGRGIVLVLGQDNDVINTYTGHPKINSDAKPFQPVYVVTTPLDNIIVSDLDTSTLHILNSVGNLITYFNTKNIGILYPFSLSFTRSGQLYIGCTNPVDSTDKAKLYKVGISQIKGPVS